ncbi:hypothetical protein LSUB1_G002660 [Lachnellula subtilissima]|uniref:Uncharacterized protein n=1 Tax=Lachnellula subtilissima TaxID=602034 RepID=A0A8H8RPG6_9HELO|nr:hypothetical protein LSUB1_G002660 [Lachnellula subtilissima]
MESKRKINAAVAMQDEVERALKRRKVLSMRCALDLLRCLGDGPWICPRRTHRPTNEGSCFEPPTATRRKADNIQDHIDLSKGESAELTTEHGLKLVDTLRRTEDKRQASSFSYCDIRQFAQLHHVHPVSLVYG